MTSLVGSKGTCIGQTDVTFFIGLKFGPYANMVRHSFIVNDSLLVDIIYLVVQGMAGIGVRLLSVPAVLSVIQKVYIPFRMGI